MDFLYELDTKFGAAFFSKLCEWLHLGIYIFAQFVQSPLLGMKYQPSLIKSLKLLVEALEKRFQEAFICS